MIEEYPKIILNAIRITENTKLPKYKFSKIIVCGMGGSAAGGYILRDLLGTIPVEISSGYHLPKYVDKNTLVFCVSYSGNTEETLSQFADALEKKYKIICITSDGKLKEWCEKLKIPYVEIPKGYLPRQALPYLFFPMVAYLQKLKFINFKKDLRETENVLKKIKLNEFDYIVKLLRNSAEIAIYTQSEFFSAAKRIKNQLNENTKLLAKVDLIPELKSLSVIFLRDKDETKEIKTRMEITKKLIRNRVKNISEIWSSGNSKLAKILSLIYVGDYLSYKLAEIRSVDPNATEFIDKIKRQLKKELNLIEKLEKRIIKSS